MRRELPGGLELDDDRERVDIDAVQRYLSQEAYRALGRLHTADAHGLCAKVGFGAPSERVMERQ